MKAVAKIIIRMSIYPSSEEMHGVVEGYLAENHSEFFNSFKETRWTAFYNANFHKHVSSV